MDDKILTAIQNLPEELITAEIAAAAVAEGKIELLDHLPHKYLTAEVVLSLISSGKSHSWHSFKLESIPESLRSDKVCEKAVSVKIDNILHVPRELLSETMLSKLVGTSLGSIKFLHIIPPELWKAEHIYSGISSIETLSNPSYGRAYRSSYDNSDSLKLLQVLFSFVPKELMNREFYRGLFTAKSKFSLSIIDAITPERYKDLAYYLTICKRDFKLVPKRFYTYTILRAALAHDSSVDISYLFDVERVKMRLFEVMDDEIANRIVIKKAIKFKELPQAFQTVERLVLAIENFSDNYCYNIIDSHDSHLLTDKVCRAFIKRDRNYPTFPSNIWTPSFIAFCLKYGETLEWFKQMPTHFQTKEMVVKVLDKRSYYMEYCLDKFISLEQAERAHKDGEFSRKYIPEHFYTEFTEQTGLQKGFFSGHVTFSRLRESRVNYTYTQLGDSFIGLYKQSESCNAYLRLIVTRRTPHSMKPTTIFDRTISTFHTTWLEKIISDYDQSFCKPTQHKSLKEFQLNGYYNVVKGEIHNGVTTYQNKLFGATAQYVAKVGGDLLFTNTMAELKISIDDAVAKQISDEQLVAV